MKTIYLDVSDSYVPENEQIELKKTSEVLGLPEDKEAEFWITTPYVKWIQKLKQVVDRDIQIIVLESPETFLKNLGITKDKVDIVLFNKLKSHLSKNYKLLLKQDFLGAYLKFNLISDLDYKFDKIVKMFIKLYENEGNNKLSIINLWLKERIKNQSADTLQKKEVRLIKKYLELDERSPEYSSDLFFRVWLKISPFKLKNSIFPPISQEIIPDDIFDEFTDEIQNHVIKNNVTELFDRWTRVQSTDIRNHISDTVYRILKDNYEKYLSEQWIRKIESTDYFLKNEQILGLKSLLKENNLSPLNVSCCWEKTQEWLDNYFDSLYVKSIKKPNKKLQESFEAWYLKNYNRFLSQKFDKDIPLNFKCKFLAKKIIEKKSNKLLWILVDSLPKFFLNKLYEVLSLEHREKVVSKESLLTVVPSTTEFSKFSLVRGERIDAFDPNVSIRDFVQKSLAELEKWNIKYLPSETSPKKIINEFHSDTDLFFWNYCEIDSLAHRVKNDDEHLDMKLNSSAIPLLKEYLENILEKAPENLEILISSDHGHLPYSPEKIAADDLFTEIVNVHTRYAQIPNESVIKSGASKKGYYFPKHKSHLTENIFVLNGGYSFKTNSVGQHGGITPEEVVVGYLRLDSSKILYREPEINVQTDENESFISPMGNSRISFEIINRDSKSKIKLIKLDFIMQDKKVTSHNFTHSLKPNGDLIFRVHEFEIDSESFDFSSDSVVQVKLLLTFKDARDKKTIEHKDMIFTKVASQVTDPFS